jgi:hypothetical protein
LFFAWVMEMVHHDLAVVENRSKEEGGGDGWCCLGGSRRHKLKGGAGFTKVAAGVRTRGRHMVVGRLTKKKG